jgi:exosortase
MSTPSLGPPLPPPAHNATLRPGATTFAGYFAKVNSPRNILFFFLVLLSVFVFWEPLRIMLDYSQRVGNHEYDKYSHTLLIPFISLALVLSERKKIFASVQYSIRVGAVVLLSGLIVNWLGERYLSQLGEENSLSVRVLGLVLLWAGGFILCYGVRAYRAGAFPLLFLLVTIPIPNSWLDVPVSAVRSGSTEVCSWIFSLTGMPVLRNGYEFILPTISIEVAKECSGIHSTLALFIVSLLAGHLLLTSAWKKVIPFLFVVPIVCVSNGLRIAGLTLLSVYVDPRFMYSNLHHEGGVGFFLIALVLLFAILHLLRRGEDADTQTAK